MLPDPSRCYTTNGMLSLLSSATNFAALARVRVGVMPADEPGCAGHNDTSAHASTLWEILEVVQRRASDCSARWVIRLLTMLQQEGRIDEELIRKLLGWRHSGFSVQNEVRVRSQDVAGRRRVAQSILRSPFSRRGHTPHTKSQLTL